MDEVWLFLREVVCRVTSLILRSYRGSKVKKSVVADSVWVWIDHQYVGLRDGMLLVRSELMDQRASNVG